MIELNLYDFDNTIYDGESTFDFFFFCLKQKKSLIKYLPIVIYTTILYKMRLLSVEKLFKSASKLTAAFVKGNFSELAEKFWAINAKKLRLNFLSKLTALDVITTASPRFLIDALLPKLGVSEAICSEMDMKTGQFKFANFGKNKVIAFKKKYPDARIKNFYTDSLNDAPLMKLAENVFLVQKDGTALSYKLESNSHK